MLILTMFFHYDTYLSGARNHQLRYTQTRRADMYTRSVHISCFY